MSKLLPAIGDGRTKSPAALFTLTWLQPDDAVSRNVRKGLNGFPQKIMASYHWLKPGENENAAVAHFGMTFPAS